jgi:hypothetical protein
MANQSPARDRTDVRIPELVGALNFRDMGGYAANDGGTIRWNRLSVGMIDRLRSHLLE